MSRVFAADEKIEREDGTEVNVREAMFAPHRTDVVDILGGFLPGIDQGEKEFTVIHQDPDQEGREESSVIAESHFHRDGLAGKDLGRELHKDFQSGKIGPSKNAGNRHNAEESRNDQVDEVIRRIHRGKAKQDRQEDIEPAGLGDFDYTGRGTSARIDFMISPLSRFSYSSLKITRCAATDWATSLISSGMA